MSNRLCIQCFKPLNGEGPCAHCGFDEAKYAVKPHHLPPRTVLHGKYLLGRVLGEGGFGITYIALDTTLELLVAVKEFFPHEKVTRNHTYDLKVTAYSGTDEDDFEKGRVKVFAEAKNMARFVNHPGIVTVRECFDENETVYIVMEYIRGRTLGSYVAALPGGRILLPDLLEILRLPMDALECVHQEHMLHRDVSPDNIMITDAGYAKLIDFGAARDVVSGGSLSVMLRPGFAPYEQYSSNGRQGPWTDVYALCATIYRLITGQDPAQPMDRVPTDTMQRPSQQGVAIEPAREQALMKGLAVFPQDRYATVKELVAALYPSAADPSPGFRNTASAQASSQQGVDGSEAVSLPVPPVAERIPLRPTTVKTVYLIAGLAAALLALRLCIRLYMGVDSGFLPVMSACALALFRQRRVCHKLGGLGVLLAEAVAGWVVMYVYGYTYWEYFFVYLACIAALPPLLLAVMSLSGKKTGGSRALIALALLAQALAWLFLFTFFCSFTSTYDNQRAGVVCVLHALGDLALFNLAGLKLQRLMVAGPLEAEKQRFWGLWILYGLLMAATAGLCVIPGYRLHNGSDLLCLMLEALMAFAAIPYLRRHSCCVFVVCAALFAFGQFFADGLVLVVVGSGYGQYHYVATDCFYPMLPSLAALLLLWLVTRRRNAEVNKALRASPGEPLPNGEGTVQPL